MAFVVLSVWNATKHQQAIFD